MTDWLSDLRDEKKRALGDSNVAKPEAQVASAELLRTEQQQISNLLQATRVEAILNEFVVEILRGHPWFPDSSLIRTVMSKQTGSTFETKEPSPWSGSMPGNPLPVNLDLANGRYVTRIDWNLGLSYRPPQWNSVQRLSIPISLSAQGGRVDGKELSGSTAENLQAELKRSFQKAIELPKERSHRRRHRRWYVRLLDQLNNKDSAAVRLLLVLALIALALLIGWLSINSNRFLPTSPRRMVEIQRSIAVGVESNLVHR